MKFSIEAYHPVAVWKWDTSTEEEHKPYHYKGAGGGYLDDDDDEDDDDVCGICRLAFESCCPVCKVPGDDCPLIWGTCTHVFHMHCLLKWIDTESSKQQCPLDRQPWETADRKPDKAQPAGAQQARHVPQAGGNGEDSGEGEDGADMEVYDEE